MNPLGPYKYVLDFLVIAALVAAAAFGVHKYNTFQQDIGSARKQAEWDRQALVDARATAELKAQYQKEKDDALAQAAKNTQAANAAAAVATQSSRVLDSTVKALLAASASGDVSANRKYTAALAEVFGDCKDRYRALGREAQGHADDSLMFQQAAPK